jgi:hypothetical protein
MCRPALGIQQHDVTGLGEDMAEITVIDPYKGKKYSDIHPKGAPFPTHPLKKVAGTGKASWDAQQERYVV